jgi:RNA polymerase sigma factor for flagellar operon FliA
MASLSTFAYSGQDADPAKERERLILEHLPQVRWVATRIHEKLPDSTSLEDLISIGIVGLINAIDNFDPQFNVKLKTYAEHKIRGAILDSLRGLDWAPRQKRRMARQVEAAILAASHRLHREPTEEEIAGELEINLVEYHEWLADLQGLNIGTLEYAGEEGRDVLAYAADDEGKLPSRLLERAELEKLLAEAIEQMPPVDRMVISLYYREELTLREIAQVVHLHPSRISQLKSQAILRLRAYMAKRWPTERGI